MEKIVETTKDIYNLKHQCFINNWSSKASAESCWWLKFYYFFYIYIFPQQNWYCIAFIAAHKKCFMHKKSTKSATVERRKQLFVYMMQCSSEAIVCIHYSMDSLNYLDRNIVELLENHWISSSYLTYNKQQKSTHKIHEKFHKFKFFFLCFCNLVFFLFDSEATWEFSRIVNYSTFHLLFIRFWGALQFIYFNFEQFVMQFKAQMQKINN